MDTINQTLHYLIDVVLVSSFGWIPFAVALVYMLFWLKRDDNRARVSASIKWIHLEVRIDELSEKSPLAMEQIFAAMHAIHQNFTWGETLNGRSVLYMSCELVSLGGKVSYIFRMPDRYRSLFESALFAQYPKAEITEVEDYLKNINPHFEPDHVEYDFWGTQWNKKKDNAYPIRTYTQEASYEHSAQETFIDPMSNVLEVMSNLQPHEMLVYQLVIRPMNDEWKKHTAHLLDELKGVPHKHSDSWWDKVIFFIPDLFADILVTHVLNVEKPEAKNIRVSEDPPSLMLHKTDVEKMVINAIAHAMGKISFECRVRVMYLAPKDKFNKGLRVPEIVGSFRNFDDVNLNGLKPDVSHTWTDQPYRISEKLEAPYLKRAIVTRKRHFLHAFLARSYWKGVGKQIMNTEELATIFHFPHALQTRMSQLERVHTVKSAPPMDLPIGR